MSEYQYIGFRAIDAPLSRENLAFMREQSTRAEVTPTSFDNEYHFGGFSGDAEGMLRRGYDFHLHYANFGIRTVMIRLPNGLPDPAAAKVYFEKDSLEFIKDKQGPAGILLMSPVFESGQVDDEWDPGEVLDKLLPLRAELIAGDLRPLYLANLAFKCDMNHDPSEEQEAPVPAGLTKLTAAQKRLAKFFGLGKKLLSAAARTSPAMPSGADASAEYAAWITKQSEATKNAWLTQLLTDANSTVRRDMLAQFQASHPAPAWPTVKPSRTVGELLGNSVT